MRGVVRDEGFGVGGLGKQLSFEEWDVVEAPGGVGDFVDQLSFGRVGGGVLVEKLLGVAGAWAVVAISLPRLGDNTVGRAANRRADIAC